MKMQPALLITLVCLTPEVSRAIDAKDIEPMVQEMWSQGKISDDELEATREHMKTMSASDWRRIESDAEARVKRNPAAAAKVQHGGLDVLDPKDFGIEMPESDPAE